jgi:hypothetical protein
LAGWIWDVCWPIPSCFIGIKSDVLPCHQGGSFHLSSRRSRSGTDVHSLGGQVTWYYGIHH